MKFVFEKFIQFTKMAVKIFICQRLHIHSHVAVESQVSRIPVSASVTDSHTLPSITLKRCHRR